MLKSTVYLSKKGIELLLIAFWHGIKPRLAVSQLESRLAVRKAKVGKK